MFSSDKRFGFIFIKLSGEQTVRVALSLLLVFLLGTLIACSNAKEKRAEAAIERGNQANAQILADINSYDRLERSDDGYNARNTKRVGLASCEEVHKSVAALQNLIQIGKRIVANSKIAQAALNTEGVKPEVGTKEQSMARTDRAIAIFSKAVSSDQARLEMWQHQSEGRCAKEKK